MLCVTILVILIFYTRIDLAFVLSCNGIPELCELDITQITLAGSHNSGSGFDGILKVHSGIGAVPAPSCFYRNQDKNFIAQLDLGIRYFDIDACWEDWYTPNKPYVCHSNAYAGSIEKMITQIDKWMNDLKNRNEVIVLHFNRDFAKENKEKTARGIIKLLSDRWGPTHARKNAGLLTIQDSLNTKLKDSINHNQRIYVIMHSSLAYVDHKSWLLSHHLVGFTWTSYTWITSSNCHNLITAMGETRCRKEALHPFVRYDLYLSSGLCIWDMASACNKYIDQGVAECFRGSRTRRKTVNFLVVDYVDKRVVDAAKKQNKINVKFYLGKDI